MTTCWAQDLGSCSGGASREHLLSAAIFTEDTISVHGFSWCRTQPRRIGLNSLVAKVLCRHHNSMLSALDSAAGQAFQSWREVNRLESVRKQLSPRRWRVVESEFDVLLLERWFAKTAINLACVASPPPTWHPNDSPIEHPPLGILRAVFGLAPFPVHMGLYHVSNQTAPEPADPVQFLPLNWGGTQFAGGAFAAWGLRFVLSLHDDPMPPSPPFVDRLPKSWHGGIVHRGIERIDVLNRGRLSQTVHLRRPIPSGTRCPTSPATDQ